jgi:WD40 repeat protein
MGESAIGHSDRILCTCFSPDGSKIVSGSWDGTNRLWNASDGTLICNPLIGHTNAVRVVKFSLMEQ